MREIILVDKMSNMVLIGWKRIRKIVSSADIVLEVLDARDPLTTMSRE